MMSRSRSRGPSRLTCALFLLAATPALRAQTVPARKPLPIDDYDRWRTVVSTAISDDGSWMTYAYHRRVADDTLIVTRLDGDGSFRVPRASAPLFSDDSRWVAYRVLPPFDEIRRLRREGRPVRADVQLLELDSGRRRTWHGVDRFEFTKGATHLALEKAAARGEGQAAGSDLILRDLGRGRERLIGSVDAFAFNDAGTLLAYTVDAAERDGNGLYLVRLATGSTLALDNDTLHFSRPTWDREGSALAALKGLTPDGHTERANVLLAFRGLDGAEPERFAFDPAGAGGFPDGMVLSERSDLVWRDDLAIVFVGIKAQGTTVEEDPEHPRADVDVFHWKDARLQSVQKARAPVDRNFTYRSAVDLRARRFVPLADSTMRSLSLAARGAWAIGRDERAYVSDWREPRADLYRVNTSTGERTLMLSAQGRTLGLSPDGETFAYWKDDDVWIYDLTRGEARNLTASAPVRFVDAEYDHPGTKPPYGIAGWTADGSGLVLNHRYDLWLQPLDGRPATNLTSGVGARDSVRFRVVRLDGGRGRGARAPEGRTLDLRQPLLLSAFGEWTKKSGYFELAGGRLAELVFEDRRFDDLLEAKDADRVLFTSSTFAEYPDYYVSDRTFSKPRRVTVANPQQAEYLWGHRVLFDFETSDGVRLQGTLAIPDDYREGERRPMIVSFYEKKSQDLHSYYAPLFESDYPAGNVGPVAELAAWVSNGYLVMQPDVYFHTGTTHSDMLDAVEAATRKVIEMGYVDPARIALTGGSFSGGGSAFIATQSKMFAAIAARAAPINLAGEFDILFGNGQNNHRYDIYGQGRYGTNPFDDFELYREQSPITHVRTMDTPLLYLHGQQDGSVEYLQGMEFYNALRFLGKPIIFLSYPDEGHNLHRYENQRDFTERLWQFLDHYLKDAPAPDWMVKGVPYLERSGGGQD